MAKSPLELSNQFTKRNYGGHQQPYVPAGNGDESGEYRDNSYGGFNNGYSLKSKPKSSPKELGIEIESKLEGKKDISQIKPSYDGQGNKLLQDELAARMGKSKNLKDVLESVSDADDELSGIIGDYYKANKDVTLKFGKNLSSKYEIIQKRHYWEATWQIDRQVLVGQGFFTQQDSYSKGGVFFHESGHALDDTFIGENGNRDNWSCSFVSSKYGKTMKDMIREEIKENIGLEGVERLKEEIKKEKELLKSKIFSPEMEQEYNTLIEEQKNQYQALVNDSEHKQLVVDSNNLINEISQARDVYNNDPTQENLKLLFAKREEYRQFNQKIEDFNKSFYAKNYPNKEITDARKNELEKIKWSVYEKTTAPINRKYGDLSDMCEGTLYKSICNMGHGVGYWNDRARGKEAFAEIMSAKATNPESLELLKKYCPKTIEIFDEIIEKIKGGKK